MDTINDRIAAKLRSHDYKEWRDRVAAIGGCSKPIRLSGAWQLHDATTGAVIHHHGGDILAPCGNRRESVCPACSDRYAADAFHLMRAGLSGGHKNIPTTVTSKPRMFATLTAPSFGPVHSARKSTRGKRIPCGCGTYHHPADPAIGAPLDPDGYDYDGAVLWQAHAGKLWHRFTIALRRYLAVAAGIPVKEFREHARLSYAKVAEYQRRGLVHFHAVIRIDGPDGAADPTPAWATAELLQDAILAAAARARITSHRPAGEVLDLVWGEQVDVRQIRPAAAEQIEDQRGEISEDRLAAYVAKYATKGTGKSEAADRPIRSQRDIEHLRCSHHHRRMIQTAWDLGALPVYDGLNLQRWAHMLGFRGHFLTKSQRYSTTFKAIRAERQEYRLAEAFAAAEIDRDSVVIVNDWEFTGSGYDTDAERELAHAISERTRQARQQNYREETAA